MNILAGRRGRMHYCAIPHGRLQTSIALLALVATAFIAGCDRPLPWSSHCSASPIVLSGTVDAHEVDLSFQVGGRIQRLDTDEGRSLRAGARKEDIDRASADLDAARAAVATAEQQLSYTRLVSTVSGVVSDRLAEQGQNVTAGQAVFRVAELDRPWVRIYIGETDLPRVTLGQVAEVVVDGLPDHVFKGHLSFISPEAEFTPKTIETRALRVDLVYRATVDVDDAGGALKIGMPADVRLAER